MNSRSIIVQSPIHVVELDKTRENHRICENITDAKSSLTINRKEK
jgi:hypothetical protein